MGNMMINRVDELFNEVTVNLILMDIKERIMTYKGSVEIQNELEGDSLILPTLILQGIEDDVINVCLDVYGNYVCQKLIKYLSIDQVIKFIHLISFDFKRLFKSIPGACIISSILKVTSVYTKHQEKERPQIQELLLNLIEFYLNDLIGDLQGCHLLQECYDLFDLNSLKFISQVVIENFYTVATDRFGCCLIKKIIIESESKSKSKSESELELNNSNDRGHYLSSETSKRIFELVLENLSNLVIDQFGNYIIQYYFEIRQEEKCSILIKKLLPSLQFISKQKFGSNVVEKLIESTKFDEKKLIFNSLIESDQMILSLAKHRYGNYVLQKCLEKIEGIEDRRELIIRTKKILEVDEARVRETERGNNNEFEENENEISNCTFYKKIKAKLVEIDSLSS